MPGIQASDKKKKKKTYTNEEGFVVSRGPTSEWRNSSSAAHPLTSEMDRALPSGGGGGTLHITAQRGSPQKESRLSFPVCVCVCEISSLSAFPSVAPQALIVQLIAQVVYL